MQHVGISLPFVIWFTGLSGAGKTTVSQLLHTYLLEQQWLTILLDGDVIRQGLCNDLDFSLEGRAENIRRVSECSQLFFSAGVSVIAAFISPFKQGRDHARSLVPSGRFIEVFVDCPLSVCESRDMKGLYQQARRGLITDFTGIHSPYEIPENPDIHLHTDRFSMEQCVAQCIDFLKTQAFI